MTFIGQLKSHFHLFKDGFFQGIGWAFGVTIGFVIISALLVILLNIAGGLPIIGGALASLVEATNQALLKRNLY